jgi:hypothetical protein
MKRLLPLFCLVTFFSPALFAQNGPPPDPEDSVAKLPRIVRDGLDAYRKDGPEEAIKTWVKNGVLDGNEAATSQVASLTGAQNLYGAYRGFHIISVRAVSGSTVQACLTLDYDHGPLFAKFVAYRSVVGSVLTSFRFDPDEEHLLPSC